MKARTTTEKAGTRQQEAVKLLEAVLARSARSGITEGEARRRKEVALMGLRELELQERQSELVRVADVTATWADISTKVRDAVMRIPSRLVNRLPDEIRRQVHTIANDEVRRVLTSLSDEIRSGGRSWA